MTAHEAIQEAQRRGITFSTAGTTLRFRGPKDALSDDLKHELKRHKPEILEILEAGPATYPCSRCAKFSFPGPGILCLWCRRDAEVPHEA